jgi:hypothetical protein
MGNRGPLVAYQVCLDAGEIQPDAAHVRVQARASRGWRGSSGGPPRRQLFKVCIFGVA